MLFKLAIRMDHYFHVDEQHIPNLSTKLDTILALLRESKQREVLMSLEMDGLAVAVTENTALDDSIIALLNGLAAQIADAAGDKAKALALSAELTAKSALLSAAITANTPVAPPA